MRRNQANGIQEPAVHRAVEVVYSSVRGRRHRASEEVTRLHAGIDISSYNTVLELSLDSMRPTRELVEAALQSPDRNFSIP